jgi:hypothetical protein
VAGSAWIRFHSTSGGAVSQAVRPVRRINVDTGASAQGNHLSPAFRHLAQDFGLDPPKDRFAEGRNELSHGQASAPGDHCVEVHNGEGQFTTNQRGGSGLAGAAQASEIEIHAMDLPTCRAPSLSAPTDTTANSCEPEALADSTRCENSCEPEALADSTRCGLMVKSAFPASASGSLFTCPSPAPFPRLSPKTGQSGERAECGRPVLRKLQYRAALVPRLTS